MNHDSSIFPPTDSNPHVYFWNYSPFKDCCMPPKIGKMTPRRPKQLLGDECTGELTFWYIWNKHQNRFTKYLSGDKKTIESRLPRAFITGSLDSLGILHRFFCIPIQVDSPVANTPVSQLQIQITPQKLEKFQNPF